jgi:hypothetical protein
MNCVTAPLARRLPEDTKNQSSIDRIIYLPKTLSERQKIFAAGLNEMKRQGLPSDVTIVPRLEEIQLAFVNSLGQYEYRDTITDPKRAEAALKANPKWFAADGVYHGKGKISIFATATSANTRLIVVANSLLELKLNSGMGFQLTLTSTENVIQTIAHEIAHHNDLGHKDVALYNSEYLAIKNYRSRQ